MEDFEEKLNTILSSPETMGQIMALANSISGEGREQSSQEAPQAAPEEAGALSSLLQGLDSGTLQTLMTLWNEYRKGQDEKTRLLEAMKPFLRQERQEKLDRAVQIARLSRVIRAAIHQFGGEGHV